MVLSVAVTVATTPAVGVGTLVGAGVASAVGVRVGTTVGPIDSVGAPVVGEAVGKEVAPGMVGVRVVGAAVGALVGACDCATDLRGLHECACSYKRAPLQRRHCHFIAERKYTNKNAVCVCVTQHTTQHTHPATHQVRSNVCPAGESNRAAIMIHNVRLDDAVFTTLMRLRSGSSTHLFPFPSLYATYSQWTCSPAHVMCEEAWWSNKSHIVSSLTISKPGIKWV